jgi:CheY-like chemotaxis protein
MADDDADDLFMVRRAIEDINFKHSFKSVSSGLELLDLLGKDSDINNTIPDCILLDINMPVQDGIETLRRIRSSKKLQQIPVYMFTTSHSEEDRKRSMELGAKAFFNKPAKYGELKNILGEICVKTMLGEENLALYN